MKHSLIDFQRVVTGLRRLWRYFRIPKKTMLAIIAASMVAAALESVGIGLLLPMLELLRSDEVHKPMKAVLFLMHWLPGYSTSVYTSILCFGVILAILLKNFLLYVGNRITATMRSMALLNLRDAIFRRIQNAELQLIESTTSGEMANVILLETGRTAYAIEFLIFLLQRVTITLCYIVALLVISWQLSILAGILAVVCGSVLGYFYKVLARSGREIGSAGEKVNSHLNEMLAGMRLVRCTNSQERESLRFYELNDEYSRIQTETMQASSALNPITESLGVIGGMAIVGFAAIFLVQPGYMGGEMLLGFAFVLLRLLPAITMVYGLYGQTISLAGGIEQSEKWVQIPQYPQRGFGARNFNGFDRTIQMQNLSFMYPNGTEALRNVNFEIKAGEITALVGGSGSGKSTIAALLLRLRAPSKGCILVDGQDYWDFSPETWHRHVAFVEQDAFLFHGTLRDNIRYGLSDVTDADIEKAIRSAHLSHVVEELPAGMDTIIGERGVMLSGGQRQRLSIARALVRNPKLLVLDEATSALDSISESQVQAALDEAQQGRSVLVIAHRFSTIRQANKIVVLENGELAEQGTWMDLESKQGAFYRLLRASQRALV